MTHAAAHHRITKINRTSGRSAVAAAAYRHNAKMTDNRTGKRHNFTRKGDLVAEGVIGWSDTTEALWNAAEDSEKRKNSVIAREAVIALPHELDRDTQQRLIRGHCLMLRDRYGVAVSWVIHDTEKKTGSRNDHAHILFTTREVSKTGEFGKKTRTLDDRKTGPGEFEHMREAWAKRANAALEKAGVAERIDHRSHKRRAAAGEAPEQATQRHMGPRLTAIARKYERATERAEEVGERPPRAPRFYTEREDHKAINAKMWKMWNAAEKAQREAANSNAKQPQESRGVVSEATTQDEPKKDTQRATEPPKTDDVFFSFPEARKMGFFERLMGFFKKKEKQHQQTYTEHHKKEPQETHRAPPQYTHTNDKERTHTPAQSPTPSFLTDAEKRAIIHKAAMAMMPSTEPPRYTPTRTHTPAITPKKERIRQRGRER